VAGLTTRTDIAGLTTRTDVTMLQIRELAFAYPDQPALASGWSAELLPGITLLFGDTGSGKTTLLRLLAGLQAAATGELVLAGIDLRESPAAYAREVYFVEPWTEAFDQVSARTYASSLQAADARFDAALWQSLVDGFSLAPHVDKPLYMLSTGSKRKVWLAAGLASGRALVLLDEPTGGLDAPSTRCLWQALDSLAQRGGGTVVLASAAWVDQVALAGLIELPLQA
jgi:ABC-type multidrug transport system ATPase subunit